MNEAIYRKSIEYLKSDLFKHMVTLKYLTIYRDVATVVLLRDGPQWAISVAIPTSALTYDTATYPQANKAIFINGTSDKLKEALLDTFLEGDYILRLNEELDLSKLKNRFNVVKGNSFISYSCSTIDDIATDYMVPANAQITDKAIDIITKNDYTEAEVRKYFAAGALWFGLEISAELKSVCFIYQNYDDIWEIAGVHTLEPERNKGYGRIVVGSALKYMRGRGFVPRYVANSQETSSIKLAESLDMKPFLKIEHFLLSPG